MSKADIGMVGLGVMGSSLALNMAGKGFSVVGFDAMPGKMEVFLAGKAGDSGIGGAKTPEELVQSLERPRKIMLMVPAGEPVDIAIGLLMPHLDEGDIIIDGGNSHFADTSRRLLEIESRGMLFVGMGVSGGEEGALGGPSLMPGGSEAAWPLIRPIFEEISARLDDGTPCCQWIGPGASGHFVKMVHNGIEYGDMQLIAESYSILMDAARLGYEELSATFAQWNTGELNSYLIEITADIFSRKDPETGKRLVEVILDAAGQKGTGSWASETALRMGVPVQTIAEAVFARSISALKTERMAASKLLSGPDAQFDGDAVHLKEAVRNTLYASKVCCYAQGFALMRQASEEYEWHLNLGNIALAWRAGCIIRAQFLSRIQEALAQDSEIPNLLVAPYFRDIIQSAQKDWREVVGTATALGIPVPAFSSALAYFDSYRSERLPANLIQAQRDYFGAHTYKRVDKDGVFHSDWTVGATEV